MLIKIKYFSNSNNYVISSTTLLIAIKSFTLFSLLTVYNEFFFVFLIHAMS